MNILSRFKRFATIGLAFGVFAIAMVGVSVIANHTTVKASTYSCSSINVINCGLDGSTTQAQITSLQNYYNSNSSGHSPAFNDIKAIYNAVGASQAYIDGMNTSNTIAGYVWRDGSVTTAGNPMIVIGKNAMSVGRFYTTNSTRVGTNAYLRSTTLSFADPVLPAIIRLDANNNIVFGAILSCGNAFTATPFAPAVPPAPVKVVTPVVTPPKPDYTILKEVAVKGTSSYAKSIDVNYGTHVVYRITVSSTGAVPVQGIAVNDYLPYNVQYVANTLKEDGTSLGTAFFNSGRRITSLDNGASTFFTYEVIVGPSDTAQTCKLETIKNVASVSQIVGQGSVVNGVVPQPLITKDSTATVNKTCTTPTVVTPPPVAKPLVVTSTYTPPPVVAVVTPPPTTPTVVATCTNLTLLTSTSNQRLVTASVAYTASTGVALTNVKFDWNDGYLTNNGVATSAQHTYAAIGTYIVTATLSFSNGSTALPASSCQASVTFSAVAPPVITPIVPTVLPNTGPGSTFALFAGVSAIGTLGYRLFLGRRLAGMIAD